MRHIPQCFPPHGKTKDRKCSLPSIEINKENLIPYELILKKYPSLHHANVIGKLAVKLARESFFGPTVLVKCTVMGCREYPALPAQELNDLKQAIFSIFPKYWQNPVGFESEIWSSCVNSVGQLCKRLRQTTVIN